MILTINAGSSNVKFAVFDQEGSKVKYQEQVNSIQDVFAWLKSNQQNYQIHAVGHRVVHGGQKFSAPVLLNQEIINELKTLIPLAPLHQPHNIAAIEYFQQEFPTLPQIACFDTAFHTTQLTIAKQFAIPAELTDEGVIRYGFHGLSYEYIASVLDQKIGDLANKKVIVAHLGNGASMCAMEQKRSVATTMAFSALDGLMMGTRSGSIDPGVLLYLLQEKKYDADKLSHFLYNSCGLLGVSNVSNDVRQLLDSESVAAQNAIKLFCYSAASEFCKLLTPLNGCDALIFTAGIGQNSAAIRKEICSWLAWMGIKLNAEANTNNATTISTPESKILVGVIATDEELVIARHVERIIR